MIAINRTTSRQDLLARAARLERQAAWNREQAECLSQAKLAEAAVRHSIRFVELTDEAESLRQQAQKLARSNGKPNGNQGGSETRRPVPTCGWFSTIYFGARIVVTTADARDLHSRVNVTLQAFIEGEVDESEIAVAVHHLIAAMNRDASTGDWLGAEDLELVEFVAATLPDGWAIRVYARGELPGGEDEQAGEWEWLSSRGVSGR